MQGIVSVGKSLLLQIVGFSAFALGIGFALISYGDTAVANALQVALGILSCLGGAFLVAHPVEKSRRSAFFLALVSAPATFFGTLCAWDQALLYVSFQVPFHMILLATILVSLAVPFMLIRYLPRSAQARPPAK
jgi:hypothetical protein